MPVAVWVQISAFAGAIELGGDKQASEPGNLGKGALDLGSVGVSASIEDPEARVKRFAPTCRGRLTVVAIFGLLF